MKIVSFIRQGGNFTPIDRFVGNLSDADYIEGAIEIEEKGKYLIRRETYDYVDQLWCYIIDAIPQALSEGKSELYFPDQPIQLAFERIGSEKIEISVSTGDDTARVVVDLHEFLSEAAASGETFFRKLADFFPADNIHFLRMSEEAKKLRNLT